MIIPGTERSRTRPLSSRLKRRRKEIVAALMLINLSASSMMFPANVYAHDSRHLPPAEQQHAHPRDSAHQDAVRQFALFADNAEAGRFMIERNPTVIAGEAHGPVPAAIPVLSVVVGIIGAASLVETVCGDDPNCGRRFVEGVIDAGSRVAQTSGQIIGGGARIVGSFVEGFFTGLFDPQTAVVLNSFEVNGVDVFQQLIARAMAPENIVFRKQLTNFLGGGTFIGSTAFGGRVLDSDGNPIPNAAVRVGVFIKNDGNMLLIPVTNFAQVNDVIAAKTTEWDLEPVVVTGMFIGTGLRVFAFEEAPQPATARQ